MVLRDASASKNESSVPLKGICGAMESVNGGLWHQPAQPWDVLKKQASYSIVIFSIFYDSWLFVLLRVQSFTKFSTQGTSVNCGAHKADSCVDCPLVWTNLHLLDDYWLFEQSIHF